MNYHHNLNISSKIILLLLFVFNLYQARAQQTPLGPVSWWVFNPEVYNPAINGSKDFLSIGVNAAFQGSSNAQLISGNGRLTKSGTGYFASPASREFTNSGIGGSAFRDINGNSKNIGISAAWSYHIPVNKNKLSFLAIGVSVKGIYNRLDNDSVGTARSFKNTAFPDFDLGLYYYGPVFFAGLSATNILGNPFKSDTVAIFRIPAARQYFFTTGFKILLSRSLNIVLEPSLLLIVNDSTHSKVTDNVIPVLKIFLDDFCFGASFHNDGKLSFFSQFRYPAFYVGAYYELEKKTAFFRKQPLIGITLGLNIQHEKPGPAHHRHW